MEIALERFKHKSTQYPQATHNAYRSRLRVVSHPITLPRCDHSERIVMPKPRAHSLLVALLLLGRFAFASDTMEGPRFESDIRPIFREYCFDCHGATAEPDANLDLRLVRFITRGGESGPAIEVGNAAESYLLDRVKSGEMPPGEAKLPQAKIELLERWILEGAKTLRTEPEDIGPGIPITLEDRNFWAFQSIENPSVPQLDHERIRTPVDAFLSQSMPDGLSFSQDAERNTLIKRAYFDLIGLPPSPEELSHWESLTSSDWYDQLVNSLLDSSHYGERWARHWLDVAGYADSEGSTVRDDERPWAWKYRDYVIRSFNADKPFDQFIIEQLAGDEIAGVKNGDWTQEQIELLTATGFLRMAADGTGSGDNSAEARNKAIADTIQIVSTSLLGLSVACAQCHDHRYDPISQLDYYGLRSVFTPAYDWQNWKLPTQRRVSLYTENDRQRAAEIEEEVKSVVAEKTEKQNAYMAQALDQELNKYEAPLKSELRNAYQTPAKERTEEQQALLKKHPSVNITTGVLYQYIPESREELKKFDERINEIRKKKPPEEFLRVLTEPPGHFPVAKLFHRGDHQQPKQDVAPAVLTIAAAEGKLPAISINDESLPTSGRRLAYARWLTNGEHPLVARVIVNRVWMHHFGKGLVSTPSDFGRLGDAPSHPELLDWLASYFMDEGWSLKKLHRLILTSTAWRQSSASEPVMAAIDPENRFYWRKPLQRLEAEIIRDRMLASSVSLDRTLFGTPIGVKEDETGQVMVDGEQKRRSLYIKARRSQPVAMLQTFDAPVMSVNCERRPVSTVATQSLMLMNGGFALQQAEKLAARSSQAPDILDEQFREKLPQLPSPPPLIWTYGYGQFDSARKTINEFKELPHWTGSEWQGGEQRPDPQIGWVILNKTGGHPGKPKFGAIRRWTAPIAGTLSIQGSLVHPSENGDGVRGRIVSSQGVVLGEWQTLNGQITTNVEGAKISQGDTIDFITDCLTNENSDSFQWTAKLTLTTADGTRAYDTADDFHGPVTKDDYVSLPAKLRTAWELSYQREPTFEEMRLVLNFVNQQLLEMHATGRGTSPGIRPSRQVLINFCQILLTSNEFLYVD